MEFIEIIKLVYKNIYEKKARTFLTISGIFIGIFTFTFFIFVSQGLSNAISEQFGAMGTNVLGIKSSSSADGPPTGEGLTDKEVSKIKQVVREIKYVAPGIFYQATYEFANKKKPFLTLAYPDSYIKDVFSDFGLEAEVGRSIREGDKGIVVVGYKVAEEGFDNKKLKVGNTVKINEKSFRIVGISKEQGDLFIDNSIVMGFSDLKEISGQDTYSVIRVSFQEGADLEYYKQKIDARLNPNGEEKKFVVTSAQEMVDQLNQIIGLLTAIITFISSIALVVGGINVMNTMYSNVIEKKAEISIMKAIGAKNIDIRYMFLFESSILGLIGAILGFAGSYSLAKLLALIITKFGYNVPIYFNLNFFIGVVLITVIFSTLFGTYPAIRASKINPSKNLNDE